MTRSLTTTFAFLTALGGCPGSGTVTPTTPTTLTTPTTPTSPAPTTPTGRPGSGMTASTGTSGDTGPTAPTGDTGPRPDTAGPGSTAHTGLPGTTADTGAFVATADTGVATPTGITGDTGLAVCTCPNSQCVVSGTLTVDTTWVDACEYLLSGFVFVGDGIGTTVLTIEAGTVIKGESSTDGTLVVQQSSRIEAVGTATQPIVFTSDQPVGSRDRGDWGGIVINGDATNNEGVDVAVEGGLGFHGGTSDTDDSGTLQYVRIEFAGALVSIDNELDALGLNSVGSNTTIDYVQVHRGSDDGVGVTGGTVDLKHIVSTQMGDDLLDWNDGWTGRGQFFVLQGAEDKTGDNGIEADNNRADNAALPRSNPTLSNLTIIGSPDHFQSDFGILLREGTAGQISNAIVAGFNAACLDIDDQETFDQMGADLTMDHVLLDCATNFQDDKGELVDIPTFFSGGTGNTEGTGDPVNMPAFDMTDPFHPTAPDFTSTDVGAVVPTDPFFDSVTHLGGMGTTDWTTGWTAYPAN